MIKVAPNWTTHIGKKYIPHRFKRRWSIIVSIAPFWATLLCSCCTNSPHIGFSWVNNLIKHSRWNEICHWIIANDEISSKHLYKIGNQTPKYIHSSKVTYPYADSLNWDNNNRCQTQTQRWHHKQMFISEKKYKCHSYVHVSEVGKAGVEESVSSTLMPSISSIKW